jgi:hypothetical protein
MWTADKLFTFWASLLLVFWAPPTAQRSTSVPVTPRQMPVSYSQEALHENEGSEPKLQDTLPFGSAPHFVIRETMHFDPVLGGWAPHAAHKSSHRAKQPAQHPPHWAPPSGRSPPRQREKHIETPHYGAYRLDMSTPRPVCPVSPLHHTCAPRSLYVLLSCASHRERSRSWHYAPGLECDVQHERPAAQWPCNV